jgi:hypothetical protein
MSTKRTVFIGPVQAVEDYLNYTKISYFSLLKLEDRPVKRTGKQGRAVVLHIFPAAAR